MQWVNHALNKSPTLAVKDMTPEEAWSGRKPSVEHFRRGVEGNHPVGAKAVGVKWIYKTKLNELGEVDKFKAWLVVKGYAQEYRIDYTEVFAPVARMDTIRMIIAVAAQRR